MSTVSRILAVIRPRLAVACGVVACAAGVAATSAGLAWLAGLGAGALVGSDVVPGWPNSLPADRWVLVLPAALLAITVARALAMYGQRLLAARLGQSVVREVREAMYARLLRAEPTSWTGRRAGELASRIQVDASRVQSLVAQQLLGLASSGLRFFALAGLAVSLAPDLAAIALLGLVPIVVVLGWFGRRVRAEQQIGRASCRERV
jgi:ATP-binding cassette, subfamily B, bacterial MsbA